MVLTVDSARIPHEIREKEVWIKSDHGARTFAGILHGRIWRDNRNFIICIVGEAGSGKSYTALSLAEMIDAKFSIDKVVYKPREFFETLDKCKKGDVVVFDEAGVGIPARDWQTIQNKMLSYVLQTFRHRNIGLIMTTPSMNFIDKQIRILTHYVIKVIRYHKYTKDTETVIYERNHDHVRDTTVFEKWLVRQKGKTHDFNPVFFHKASDHLCEAYEELSRERKIEVERDAKETLKAIEEGIKTNGYDGRHIRKMINISKAYYKLYKLLKEEHGYTDADFGRLLGISPLTVSNWANWIEAELINSPIKS